MHRSKAHVRHVGRAVGSVQREGAFNASAKELPKKIAILRGVKTD
jgi:hypothetical protein